MPTASAALWQNLRRFQADKVNPWLGFRNSLGIAIPLLIGAAAGSMPAGLAMATGALNVAFRDSDAPYLQRARQMLVASIVAGVAVFMGTLCAHSTAIVLPLVTVWAFGAGMLVAISQPAADLGTMSVVMLLVYSSVPLHPQRAALAGLGALAGGLIQAALSLALWPLRRYDPERQALADLYAALSRTATSPPETASLAPPATAQSLAAQSALASLDQDRSIESERYRLLLSQAERMRVSMLALSRVATRIRREEPEGEASRLLDRYCQISAIVLKMIATSLATGVPAVGDPAVLPELAKITAKLREPDASRSSAVETMLADARFQADALAGQLRTALELASASTPEGIFAFDRREARKPWNLRLFGSLAILRANLSINSAACRHAIRLALCVLIGDAIARGVDFRRSYWLPMTIAIVLKPDFAATFSRGLLRLAGTFVGVGFATVLVHLLPASGLAAVAGLAGPVPSGAHAVLDVAPQILAITIFMFAVRCWGGANYGILAMCITAVVVFLISLNGVSATEVIAARALNTVIGGSIALLAYWLWPTWERTQVSELLARMLDSFRDYTQALLENYHKPDDEALLHALDRKRVAARLARTNFEASVERSNAEPGASVESIRSLNAMIASSHRLAHAILALEAGLPTAKTAPPRAEFRKFAHDVEITVHSVAAALRGSTLEAADLPDLREDHRLLVASGDYPRDSEPYELRNVEADRIVNSLNTLREEVLRWIETNRKQ